MRRLRILLVLLVAAGCGGDSTDVDPGLDATSPGVDAPATSIDAGDAGAPPIDGSPSARAWTAPAGFSANVGSYDVTIDAAGVATAVWSESGDTFFSTNVKASRYTPGAGWSAPMTITHVEHGAGSPLVGADASGHAIAIWHQANAATYWDLLASRYTPGTGWSEPELLDVVDFDNVHEADLAVAANGDAMVVWNQSDGDNGDDAWGRRFTAGAWGPATRLEHDDGTPSAPRYAGWPTVVIDGEGQATAAWLQSNGALRDVWIARATAAGVWSPPAVLHDGAGNVSMMPQLVVDPAGVVTALWGKSSDGEGLWMSRFTAAWSAPARMPDEQPHFDVPSMTVDASGTLTVAWMQRPGTGGWDLWANRYVPGAGWGTPTRMDTTRSVGSIATGGDAAGDVLVVWSQGDDELVARRFTPAEGWGAITAFPAGIDDAGAPDYPRVAVSPAGAAAVVWTRSAGPIIDAERWSLLGAVYE